MFETNNGNQQAANELGRAGQILTEALASVPELGFRMP
jgi:hypothetical protein